MLLSVENQSRKRIPFGIKLKMALEPFQYKKDPTFVEISMHMLGIKLMDLKVCMVDMVMGSEIMKA